MARADKSENLIAPGQSFEVCLGVEAPVLVVRGMNDTIMSHAYSEAIAQKMNQVHPGHARYLEVEGMKHGFTGHGSFYGPLIPSVELDEGTNESEMSIRPEQVRSPADNVPNCYDRKVLTA